MQCLVCGSTLFSLDHFCGFWSCLVLIWWSDWHPASVLESLVDSFQCLAKLLCWSWAAFASCGLEQEKSWKPSVVKHCTTVWRAAAHTGKAFVRDRVWGGSAPEVSHALDSSRVWRETGLPLLDWISAELAWLYSHSYEETFSSYFVVPTLDILVCVIGFLSWLLSAWLTV